MEGHGDAVTVPTLGQSDASGGSQSLLLYLPDGDTNKSPTKA